MSDQVGWEDLIDIDESPPQQDDEQAATSSQDQMLQDVTADRVKIQFQDDKVNEQPQVNPTAINQDQWQEQKVEQELNSGSTQNGNSNNGKNRQQYYEDLREIMRLKEVHYKQIYARDRMYRQRVQDKFVRDVVLPNDVRTKSILQWRQKAQQLSNQYHQHQQQQIVSGQYRRRHQVNFQDGPERYELLYSGSARRRLKLSGQDYYYDYSDSFDCDVPEVLVPIRIEINLDTSAPLAQLQASGLGGAGGGKDHLLPKLRDTFTWNLNEKAIGSYQFAAMLCEDYGISVEYYSEMIGKQIEEQLDDFVRFGIQAQGLQRQYMQYFLGRISHQDAELYLQSLQHDGISAGEVRCRQAVDVMKQKYPYLLKDTKSSNSLPGELRCPVKISCVVGNVHVEDQMEVDLYSFDTDTPECISSSVCVDLGLGGEFYTAIAHQIREQVWIYVKLLICVGFAFDGSDPSAIDEEVKSVILPVLNSTKNAGSVIRPQSSRDEWTPMLNFMADYDMDKWLKERDGGSIKKKKRTGRYRRSALQMKEGSLSDQFGFQVSITETGLNNPGRDATTQDENGIDLLRGAHQSQQNIPLIQVINVPEISEPPRTMRSLLSNTYVQVLGSSDPQGDDAHEIEWVHKYCGIPDTYKQHVSIEPQVSNILQQQQPSIYSMPIANTIPKRQSRAAAQAAQSHIKEMTQFDNAEEDVDMVGESDDQADYTENDDDDDGGTGDTVSDYAPDKEYVLKQPDQVKSKRSQSRLASALPPAEPVSQSKSMPFPSKQSPLRADPPVQSHSLPLMSEMQQYPQIAPEQPLQLMPQNSNPLASIQMQQLILEQQKQQQFQQQQQQQLQQQQMMPQMMFGNPHAMPFVQQQQQFNPSLGINPSQMHQNPQSYLGVQQQQFPQQLQSRKSLDSVSTGINPSHVGGGRSESPQQQLQHLKSKSPSVSQDTTSSTNNTTTSKPAGPVKHCEFCGIASTETPLMRKGPGGKSTLCNKCGLKYAKKQKNAQKALEKQNSIQ
ncbi:hypothetical protein MP228_010211 [Amoeboaphelidium protococcarum]|nr:hypothetical protein MP228_010211 [Amoeboaphelidium protococcarum]